MQTLPAGLPGSALLSEEARPTPQAFIQLTDSVKNCGVSRLYLCPILGASDSEQPQLGAHSPGAGETGREQEAIPITLGATSSQRPQIQGPALTALLDPRLTLRLTLYHFPPKA